MGDICIHDKGNQYSVYDSIGRGLKISVVTFYDNNDQLTFIEGWNYYDGTNHKCGKSQSDLIDFLKELSSTKKVISKAKKEICLIYTDDLYLLKGFLQPILTNDTIDSYFQVLDTVEFREISSWSDDIDDEFAIQKIAYHIINDIFIPDKYYYLTPNQQPRKYITKKTDKALIKKLSPKTPKAYAEARQAIFGGLLFGKRKYFTWIEKPNAPITYVDLNSAYIYALLAKKYPMKEFIDSKFPQNWSQYHDEGLFTFGLFKITYKASNIMITTFKDINGNNLLYDNNEHNVEIRCCGTDMITISRICDYIKVKCIKLSYTELDYLPENIRNIAQDEYIKKEKLRGTGIKYSLQKKVVNGIPGDSTRKAWDNKFNNRIINGNISSYERDYYNDLYDKFLKNNCIYSIYWGIQLTSYIRALLFDIAIKTDAIYGDTDGLFMYSYKENEDVIDYYNDIVNKEIMSLPDIKPEMNDYRLGQFKIEQSDIKKFKWFNKKTYAYEILNPEIGLGKPLTITILKAAGMPEQSKDYNKMHIFDESVRSLNYGSVPSYKICPDTIKHGSYESIGYTKIYYRDLNDPIQRVLLHREILKGKMEE